MDYDKTTLAVLIENLFASKPEDKKKAWLKIFNDEEFETVGELKKASEETWNSLSLPLAIKDVIKQALAAPPPSLPKPVVPVKVDTRPVIQMDVIVFDVSGSMKSRSFDPLNTRLGCAKILFHSMVDKLVAHELPHLLGLVLFGENIRMMPFVRDYEAFHDTLGDAEADECSTKLWDAIKRAAEEIIDYKKIYSDRLATSPEPCTFRIFCLTDGEDNASSTPFWQVAKLLQGNNIILDAFPLATKNAQLQAMTHATGGICINVSDMVQGVALFEREAMLRTCVRERSEGGLVEFNSGEELLRFVSTVKVVEEIKSAAPPKAMNTQVMKKEDFAKVEQSASSSSGTSASTKRLLAEYRNLIDSPIPGFYPFITSTDTSFWKLIMEGPPGTPYAGGRFALYFQFPADFPFRPPSVRFVTKIYHCNISNDGKICIDILQHGWSPAIKIRDIFTHLSNLLQNPNPADALDTVKANVLSDDKALYERCCAEWTKMYASESMDEMKRLYQIED